MSLLIPIASNRCNARTWELSEEQRTCRMVISGRDGDPNDAPGLAGSSASVSLSHSVVAETVRQVIRSLAGAGMTRCGIERRLPDKKMGRAHHHLAPEGGI